MRIEAFFTPKSIAVIGASTSPHKLGHAVLKNLVEGGFVEAGGVVYPINPGADEILGMKAYADVTEVEGPVELAVIVIPYQVVPEALEACGQKGVKSAIIITAGFREAGREGLKRELELVEIADRHGIRLVGPNCLGVIDTFTPLNASFSAGMPPQGPMAFMSQSGALGTAILDWAMAGRLGMSKFVSLGNKADVNEVDLLHAWADDENSNVILMYVEGLPDGQAFIETARQVSKKKPIVALKSGITQAGSRAVSSHTGSLAGSEQAYGAAFRQAGVLRADTLQSMFDFALGFGYMPALRGGRVAIVTNAGGPGILVTDALERAGLRLAELSPECVRRLEAELPDAASASNPVDVLGDARAERYRFALEQVVSESSVDAIIVILTPQAMTEIETTAQIILEQVEKVDIPILACFMGEARIKQGTDLLQAHGVPNFPYPERAALVLSAMLTYKEYQAQPVPTFESIEGDAGAVRQVLAKARAEGRVTVGDAESQAILTAYGIDIPPARLAANADEAVEIAGDLGYPVVLKIASPDILHKTDVGGVRIDLRDAGQVRDAFDLITYRAQRYLPEARLWGCLVQKMASSGLEVLIGMNRDPQFGPLVTFGLGGIYVETLRDVAFRIAPFSRAEAEEMIREIRARALLDGVRGEPAVDQESIVDTLLRIGQLVQDFPEIAELDINPYVVYERGEGGLALDMRLVLINPDESARGASDESMGESR
ncbi:MAG TPA: acetate--CoA ligase family protein [Anaerolineales bacterium]